MKYTKRLMCFVVVIVVSISNWAQMEITFSGLNVTESTLADGSTYVQLPAGTDLNNLGRLMTITIGGQKVNPSDITPNPTTTFITDGEIETFVYDGKAYSFRFVVGEYFTAVLFGDPHVAQDHGVSVAKMQALVAAILNLGKDGGKSVSFSKAPKGYTATADIVLCLGDMDKDNETSGNDFKNAMQGFNDANIPFITIVGNHDLVPEIYWDSDDDYGLSISGRNNDKIALELVKAQYTEAANYGVSNLEVIEDKNCDAEMQMGHFTFTYKGVRFYCANNYWFQKPYSGSYVNILGAVISTPTYYATDGTIDALDSFVEAHANEPSIWISHFPFYSEANSDNDASERWWLDQNNWEKGLMPTDGAESEFHNNGIHVGYKSAEGQILAEKKKKALADIVVKTKNPHHFSGHSHRNDEIDVTATNGLQFTDHTIEAVYSNQKVFAVLCKEGVGVVEIKTINF